MTINLLQEIKGYHISNYSKGRHYFKVLSTSEAPQQFRHCVQKHQRQSWQPSPQTTWFQRNQVSDILRALPAV